MKINLPFAVENQESSYEPKLRSSLVAEIHLEFEDGSCFPDKYWVDFPSAILTWWARGIVQLLKGSQNVENSFMDGPYQFDTKMVNGLVKLQPIESRINGNVEVLPPVQISLENFIETVINSLSTMIEFMRLHPNLKDREYNRLLYWRGRLRAIKKL